MLLTRQSAEFVVHAARLAHQPRDAAAVVIEQEYRNADREVPRVGRSRGHHVKGDESGEAPIDKDNH